MKIFNFFQGAELYLPNIGKNFSMLCIGQGNPQFTNLNQSCANQKKYRLSR
jgi:hypothetical protein